MLEEYKEVSEADYKNLEDIFKDMLTSSSPFITENPELREELDTFIVNVGVATKDLLQKYGTQDYVHKMEVEDYKQQMLDMKRKMVKMKLSLTQVTNAINQFKNISKS